jgi:hypothetical protein
MTDTPHTDDAEGPPTDHANEPPRWAEGFLRLGLAPRDRDTIAGDLLEEYRQVILPARGRLRADLWYVRQVLSLGNCVTLGAVLGIVLGTTFGLFNLIATPMLAQAEDTPTSVLMSYSPMFLIWGAAGFVACLRSGRLIQAVKVSFTAALVTFLIFDILNLARVNLFLEMLQRRSDWQNLVSRYHASGLASLRTYANYQYVTMAPLHIVVASMIGAAMGLVGGLVGRVGRVIRPPSA